MSNIPSTPSPIPKTRPPLPTAAAPRTGSLSKNVSTARPPGRPPKEITEDHLQATIGDGFRVVAKRGHSNSLTTSNDSPSSSPPTKVPNTHQDSLQPPNPTENNPEMEDDSSQHSEESVEPDETTTLTLLQRLNALEVYVAAQDQRILNLEAEVRELKGTQPPSMAADNIIQELQAKMRNIEANPKPSYRDAAAKGIPDLASAVIKEQAERLKRCKSLVIRDNSTALNRVVQTLETSQADISNWLHSHGLTPADTDGMTTRTIQKTNVTSSSTAAQTNGTIVIVTLPTIIDRISILTKIKKSIRTSPTCASVYVDPDLTPSEAKEQQVLRQERNRLNSERSAEEVANYHYGIRSGRVVKLSH
jgi:hypothetical protein